MMEELNLPEGHIPDRKPKQLPPAVFYEWLERNMRNLHKSGQLDRIRKQPTRRPVSARFTL